jgi:two-component system, OmpR family, phosphate regulon response regulator PhoB
MERIMQHGTTLSDVGRPVDHVRSAADALQEGKSRLDVAPTPGLTGARADLTMISDQTAPASEMIGTTDLAAPAAMPVVLLAGEKGLISLLRYVAENNGFDCILTDNFTEAMTLAEIEQPDLIALDDTLCGESATAAREKISQNLRTRHIPALIMAGGLARPDSTMSFPQRTYYLLKPILPEVFIDWLHDLMRQSSSAVSTNVLRFADIVMERDAHRVYRSRRCIRLCPVEYRILQQLLEYQRKVLSREQILGGLRTHSQHTEARSIDVHISRIRKALCQHGEPNYIRTVRGLGYSLDVAPEGPASYIPRPKLIHAPKSSSRSDAPVAADR